MSNSAQKSFEEKIVEKLRDQTLIAAIGDEDAILDLVKQSITKALDAEYQVDSSYNSRRTSPIKEAAREAASEITKKVVAELLEDEEIKKAIQTTIIEVLPVALLESIRNYVSGGIYTLTSQISIDVENRVRQAFMNSGYMPR